MILRRLVAASTAVLLTGCVSASPPAPSASPTAPPGSLRSQYGIPSCPATDPGAQGVEGGLPRTDLPCLGTGQRVNLAGLPRVATVINLWAQWCAPCREESPVLREASSRIRGVRFIGINYNDPKPDWAIEFAGRVGWRYPHVMDQDKTLRAPLRVVGIPTTVFVAADGRIAGVHSGVLRSTEQLRGLVAKHLGVS